MPRPCRALLSRAAVLLGALAVLAVATAGCGPAPAPAPRPVEYPDLRQVRTVGGLRDALAGWSGPWSLLATSRAAAPSDGRPGRLGPRVRSTVAVATGKSPVFSFQGPVAADGSPAGFPSLVWAPDARRCFFQAAGPDGAPGAWSAATAPRVPSAGRLSFGDAFLSWSVPLAGTPAGAAPVPWFAALAPGTPVVRDGRDLTLSVPAPEGGTWELRVYLGAGGAPVASSARLVGAAPAPGAVVRRQVAARTWAPGLSAPSAVPAPGAGRSPCLGPGGFAAPR